MKTVLLMQYKEELKKFNTAAGILHFILVVVILCTVAIIDSPFYLQLNKFFTEPDIDNFAAELKSSSCASVEYVNAFNWLKCLDKNITVYPQKYSYEELGKMKVWILLVLFEFITSMSHFYLGANDYLYNTDVLAGMNPVRWREYSITNSLMIVAILSLSNVTDVYIILSVAFAASIMNYVGGFVYELLASLETIISIDKRRLYLIREAKIVILLLTWSTFILSIVYLFDMFFKATLPLYELANSSLWMNFFTVIFILNVGIVVLYSVFPIIHTLQHQSYFDISYITIEKSYIVASLVAKSFLTIIVFVATVQRN